jgi:capsular exopolysaccharide synthesis family protein
MNDTSPTGEHFPDGPIVRAYLAAIYRRRWTAFLVFAVVTGLLVARSLRVTPVYEATARILIEADRPNVVSFEDVVDTNRRAIDYFQTQYRLLTSRALVKRALESSGLVHNPAFGSAPTVEPSSAPESNPWRAARAFFSPASDVRATALPGDDGGTDDVAIGRFLSGLTVTPIRNSRLVDVTFASQDRVIAQRAANAIVAAYIEQAADVRNAATKDAASFLTQMLEEQRGAVEQSELALQQYREQGNTVPVGDRENIVTDRLSRMNDVLTRARTDRIEKETAYKQVSAAASSGASSLELVPIIRDNPAVQRLSAEVADLQRRKADLSQELTERHPEMVKATAAIDRAQAKLQEEVTRLVGSIRTEYEAASALERAMTQAVDQQRSEAVALNRRGLDYGVLERDAETNRKLYDALLQRAKEAGITEQFKAASVRVVDTAPLPQAPARPNRRMDALVALGAGLALALTTVFTIEAFDTRIKSPHEITERLKLAALGMVPLTEGTAGAPLINAAVPQNFVEAFKSLRTSVLFASADRGAKSVLVSSTAPGEGKTLVSCNLALALAMTGQRVLVVDADMRRPKVHDVFGVPESPGLSDVLVGSVSPISAMRLAGHELLRVLPAGTLPPNPPELLGSRQFDELMEELSGKFDWVIFDSPPVRAVTDAAVLANRVTSVLFVIGSEMTDVSAAKVALERLRAVNARITGAVLNRVNLRRHSYYYSQYYGRKDERYYTSRHARRA